MKLKLIKVINELNYDMIVILRCFKVMLIEDHVAIRGENIVRNKMEIMKI